MSSESLFVLQGIKLHVERFVYYSIIFTLHNHYSIIATESGSILQLAKHIKVDLDKKWPNYFEDDDVLHSAFFDPSAIYNFKNDVDWKVISTKFTGQSYRSQLFYSYKIFDQILPLAHLHLTLPQLHLLPCPIAG